MWGVPAISWINVNILSPLYTRQYWSTSPLARQGPPRHSFSDGGSARRNSGGAQILDVVQVLRFEHWTGVVGGAKSARVSVRKALRTLAKSASSPRRWPAPAWAVVPKPLVGSTQRLNRTKSKTQRQALGKSTGSFNHR